VGRLALTAVVLGALVSASSASAGARNACALVTATDVSSALKAKVGVGKQQQLGAFNACVYAHGKVTVTVKTRQLSLAAHRAVIKAIPGLAIKASDVSEDAWVFFITNGSALDDWKQGNEIDFVVTGAGANAVLILKQLGKRARSRI
jgi:hypothetical protein